jgi:ADP-ribose pyrophosphatase
LSLARPRIVARFPNGEVSAPFTYDVVTRPALDAVVMAVHFRRGAERFVYLRSAVRPAAALRPIPPAHDGLLWELPAGLIDPGEQPVHAAVREIEEELGFSLEPASLRELGHWMFPAPAFIAEEHHFFHAEVDPAARRHPTEDGSALERHASVVSVPLADALAACASGAICDAKTELGLRRLAEIR